MLGNSSRAGVAAGSEASIAEHLRVPLYHQIYLVIRDKIVTGTWPDGSRLPNEEDLSSQFGVSRITVRRALDDLSNEGLVQRRRGTGTTVSFRPSEKPVVIDFSNMLEQLQRMGASTQVSVLEFGELLPPAEVAAALGLEPGERAQRSVRIRSIDDRPFSYLVTWIPPRIARGITRIDLEARPLLKLIEERGVAIGGGSQQVTASLADPQIAPKLGVDVGAALLTVTRVMRDTEGRGVEHLTAHYRPDRYQFHMELMRVTGASEPTWQSSI